MSREDMIRQEIQLYLCSFKVACGSRMTATEKKQALERGIQGYFEQNPSDWNPLSEYVESGWDEDDFGMELERLLVPALVLRVHNFLREEMGYEWLNSERVFAYDYSF